VFDVTYIETCMKFFCALISVFFFFNVSATTDIYTLSLHDALPIWLVASLACSDPCRRSGMVYEPDSPIFAARMDAAQTCFAPTKDRKSTRLNSSHVAISYAVFCLKKKIQQNRPARTISIAVVDYEV